MCRAKVTRLLNEAEKLVKQEESEMEEIQTLLDRINIANNNLKEANEKAMPHLEESKLEEEFEMILEYDDRVAISASRLQQRLAVLARSADGEQRTDPRRVQLETENSNGDRQDNRSNGHRPPVQFDGQVTGLSSVIDSTVRLPKLNLKTFNGDLHEFIPFWEQFKSAVHENRNLDSAAKFNYLKSVLTGRALETINGLTPSEACYNDAIDMIKNEFGNKERIIDSYIQQLINLNPVKGKHDVTGLRKLYNTTSAVTRSLNALGISSEKYGLMVKTILMKSLPFQLKVEFNKKSGNGSDSDDSNCNTKNEDIFVDCKKQIDSLLKFIKREVDSVESAQAITSASTSVEKEERKVAYGKKKRTIRQYSNSFRSFYGYSGQ